MLRSTFLVACGLAFALPALAYTDACNENSKLYCADVTPGNGRLTQCMIANLPRLSPACAAEIHGTIEQRVQFKQSCGADAQSLCPKVKPGQGRLYGCLKFNEDKLSPACKKHLAKTKER